MQYIFGILMFAAVSYYGGAAVGRYLKKRNRNKKTEDEETHTLKQKDFYRGRTTKQDWNDWYNNM